MLIAETRFTCKNYLKMSGYAVYLTHDPSDNFHGGTAILIKEKIDYHEIEKYEHDYLQATSIVISSYALIISAAYCPPKHAVNQNQFSEYFETLGHRFIAGGDWNIKHFSWDSRLISSRGRQLNAALSNTNL